MAIQAGGEGAAAVSAAAWSTSWAPPSRRNCRTDSGSFYVENHGGGAAGKSARRWCRRPPPTVYACSSPYRSFDDQVRDCTRLPYRFRLGGVTADHHPSASPSVPWSIPPRFKDRQGVIARQEKPGHAQLRVGGVGRRSTLKARCSSWPTGLDPPPQPTPPPPNTNPPPPNGARPFRWRRTGVQSAIAGHTTIAIQGTGRTPSTDQVGN